MRVLVSLLFLVLIPGCATSLDRAPVHLATPVETIDTDANLTRDGKFYFAGQPDEATLRTLADRGVVKVINLRRPEEMAERVAFDEPALLEDEGVAYVNLVFPAAEERDAFVDELASELALTRGPVLIHCGSSNRAGAAWGRYLRLHRGFSAEAAVLRARAAGVTSDALLEWVGSPVPFERTMGGRP